MRTSDACATGREEEMDFPEPFRNANRINARKRHLKPAAVGAEIGGWHDSPSLTAPFFEDNLVSALAKGLYADEDLDEMIAAQEKCLDAVGFESGSVQ